MVLYYSVGVSTIIAFLIYVFYYKILFNQAIQGEIKSHHDEKKYKTNTILWMANFVNIYIIALIYATFGYTFNIFVLAPVSTPYALSMFFWLMITAALIMSTSRTKQSQQITFLHSGFWLTIFLLFAILFPFLMQMEF